MYKTITLEQRIKKGVKQLFLSYTSENKDTTGLGGVWKGEGHYADVHLVSGHYVLISMGMTPIAVYHTLKEMMEETGKITGALMIYKV